MGALEDDAQHYHRLVVQDILASERAYVQDLNVRMVSVCLFTLPVCLCTSLSHQAVYSVHPSSFFLSLSVCLSSVSLNCHVVCLSSSTCMCLYIHIPCMQDDYEWHCVLGKLNKVFQFISMTTKPQRANGTPVPISLPTPAPPPTPQEVNCPCVTCPSVSPLHWLTEHVC